MSTFGVKQSRMHGSRNLDDPPNQSIDDPFSWILENKDTSQDLAHQMESVRDKNLPERLVESIANALLGNAESRGEQTDCIKLLVCKSAPIVWGMQRAITDRIDGTANGKDDDKPKASDDNSNANKIEAYFKYLPDLTEFRNHGDGCEARYNGCKVFS